MGERTVFGCYSASVDLQKQSADLVFSGELPVASYDFRGGRTTCAIDIGFARSGNVQIELLRPVRGVGLHSEFLASNGPGGGPSSPWPCGLSGIANQSQTVES